MRARRGRGLDHGRRVEQLMPVLEAQATVCLVRGGVSAVLAESLLLDLEQVGEVRPQPHTHLDGNRRGRVTGEDDVVVQAVAHEPPAVDGQGLGPDPGEIRIGEEEARRVVVEFVRGQQPGRRAPDGQHVGRQEPSVLVEQPAHRARWNVPSGVGEHERGALQDPDRVAAQLRRGLRGGAEPLGVLPLLQRLQIGQAPLRLLGEGVVADLASRVQGLLKHLLRLVTARAASRVRGVLQPLVCLDDQLEDLVRLHPHLRMPTWSADPTAGGTRRRVRRGGEGRMDECPGPRESTRRGAGCRPYGCRAVSSRTYGW